MILIRFLFLLKRRLVLLISGLIFCMVFSFVQAEDSSGAPSAFAVFKAQAELGDREAQYNLGVMFETGWSVPVNNQKAVRWYIAAAKQGHANAQLRLGMLYYLGIGAAQSNIKGEKWIRKAGKQGQPLAERLNQVLFKNELADVLSPASVISQVREAYLNDEHSASPVLESLLRSAKQQALRVEKEKQQTSLRERHAQRNEGGLKKPGFVEPAEEQQLSSVVPAFLGEATDEEKRTLARGSIATIRLQAEVGVASAQYSLGRMHELGIKLPLDKKRALEWYEKSAQQGFAAAEYRIGIAYLYGVGVERDEVNGNQWLVLAAEHGHPVARNLVADFKNTSVEFQQGVSIAVRWYLQRALAGDAQAAVHLGKAYEYGWGVRSDLNEALKWYQIASQSGHKSAQDLVKGAQIKLVKEEKGEGPRQLASLMEKYALPVWLANPLVLLSFLLVVLWTISFYWWRHRKKNISGRNAAGV